MTGAVTGVRFLQALVAGVGVGMLYALIALGFVIIYKATGVINFAQGSLVMLGAYFCFTFKNRLDVPFYLAILLAMVTMAALGLVIEALILRRMVGRPIFAIVMVTIGVTIVADQVVTWLWQGDAFPMNDPWGLKVIRAGNVVIAHATIARIVAATAVLLGFFAFFRYSKMGVAMRATASDQEAALANGISAKRVFGLSWAISAAIAALAGILLSSGAGAVNPGISFIALFAFPALILGGLDSAGGAVIGGLAIGLVEELTKLFAPDLPKWIGLNPHSVMPYLVLVAVLMVRPHGLFGTKEVERV